MKNSAIRSMFADLKKRLRNIEEDIKHLSKLHETDSINFDSQILKLPKTLQVTLIAMSKMKRKQVQASDVAGITGRHRAIESGHLNQLVRMGLLLKHREKRKIFFSFRDRF